MGAEPVSAAAGTAIGYQVGDLLVDMRLRRVTRDGVDLGIVGRSFELLVALAAEAPRLVSSDELMDRVWAGLVVNPETVTQRVKLLRKALADDAENPRYVVALRGFGYRIVATVEDADRAAGAGCGAQRRFRDPPPTATESASALPAGPRSTNNRRVLALGASLSLLVLAAGVIWRALEHRNAPPDSAEARMRGSTAVPGPVRCGAAVCQSHRRANEGLRG